MELLIDQEFRKLIPPLNPSELALLEESILKEGVRDALITWNGYIVDGHNRYDIITKHGIKDYRVIEKKFADKDEAKIWIKKNQIGRRNISNYLRAEYVFDVQEWEDLKRRAREKQQLSKGRGQKGSMNSPEVNVKKTLASKLVVSEQTASRIIQIHNKATEEQKEKLRKGESSINEVYKEVKSEEKSRAREDELNNLKARAIDIPKDDHVHFYLGDFTDIDLQEVAQLKDNSIDHIITDPPYKAEFLPLWSDLSKFADRVLKPGGFCITYSGTYHLPESVNRLSEHLQYYWQFIILHKGIWHRIDARHLTTGYKPILVFVKPPAKAPLQSTWDIIEGTGREKGLHEWAQAEGEMEEILNRLTIEGDTILDPFAGSGTVAMACRNTNRFNISIEKDKHYYEIALGRLSGG